MKILGIKIWNINSLKGEHSIRFDEPPLVDAGLFAIVGKTGAGKTTILDAICLALYGRTPRFKNGEEVMSWGTGSCYSELEFSCREGDFRARWELRRAYGKADGKLGNQQRELSRLRADGTGDIITTRIKEVNIEIEKLTRLDFDRFTRSVLLPQGEFARFLRANEKERSALLESITGTQLYSELSTAAYDRHQLAEKAVAQLSDKRENLQLLRPEERDEAEKEKSELNKRASKLQKKVNALRKKLDLLEQYRRLMQGRKAAELKIAELSKQIERAKPARKRYADSTKVRPKANDLLRIGQLNQKIQELSQNCSERKKSKKQWQERLPELNQLKEARQAKLVEFNAEKPRRERLIDEARDLQLRIDDRQKLVAKDRELLADMNNQLAKSNKALDRLARQKAERVEKTEQLHKQLSALSEVEETQWSSDWTLLETQVKAAILALERKLEQLGAVKEYKNLLKDEIARADEKEDIQAELAELEVELLNIADRVAEAEKSLQIADEAVSLMRQQDLVTDLRKSLKKEEPCPVCGSLDHPAMVNWKAPSEALRKKTEQERARSEALVDKYKHEESQLMRRHSQMAAKLQSRLENDTWNTRYRSRIEQLEAVFARQGLLTAEQPARRSLNIKEQLSLLVEMTGEWSPESSIQYKDKKTEIDRLTLKKEALENEVEKNVQASESREREIATWAEQIGRMLGGLSVDQAKNKLEAQAEQLRSQLQETIEHQNEAATKLDGIGEEIARLEAQIISTKKEWDEQLRLITSALKKIDIESVDQARDMLMTVEEEQRWAKIIGEEDAALQAAQQALKTLNEQLLQFEESAVEANQEQLWRSQLEEIEDKRAACLRRQGALQEMLKADESKKAELGKLLQEMELAERELLRWSTLKDLIGMKDGSRFREFAQGLTLAKLVQLANRHLAALNGRYLLERPADKNLELVVVDTYQADNKRPTHTLSGGESFILSLALALGLSDLAGRNTKIDSLFIDEGFGTLDNASLDLVLDVLDKLRGQGKTIGLISHVRTLQERIFHQVRIVSDSDGFGRLQIV